MNLRTVRTSIARHICVLAPNLPVGARQGLANLRPAVLEDHLLRDVEELHWRAPR